MAADEPKRSVDDAGEKIGGARKDWRGRAMAPADLAAMTAAEQALLVKKDAVWPPPDYRAMVAGGADSRAAALVKIVRDRLPNKPNQYKGAALEKSAADYVGLVAFLRDALTACKDVEDVAKVERALYAHVGWQPKTNDRAVNARLFSIYKGRHNPARIFPDDHRKASDMCHDGFPEPVPAWRKGIRLGGGVGGTPYQLLEGRQVVGEGFPTPEAAWAWLEERSKAPAKPRRKEWARPHLDRLERAGPDARGGADVTPERFIEDFGFRGVEFGNWLPDSERQQVLNAAYDACADLADALGMERRDLSLGGTLAVAFGARGQGGAPAHYEPGRRVLNMTRIRGAGLLAHEFGHALDHWLGATGGGEIEGDAPRYASGYRSHKANRAAKLPMLSDSLAALVDDLMNACRTSPKTQERAVEDLRAKAAALEAELAKFAANLDKYRSVHPEGRRDEKYVAQMEELISGRRAMLGYAYEQLEAAEAAAPDGDFGKTSSSFIENAKALCGPTGEYWLRPTEMFARAFEAAVFDRLAAQGRRSDYLVYGVEDGAASGPEYAGDPYPSGAERQRLNAIFGEIMVDARLHLEFLRELAPAPDARPPGPRR